MSLQLVVAVVFLSNGIQRTHKRFEKKNRYEASDRDHTA